jgi:hypothetical protein
MMDERRKRMDRQDIPVYDFFEYYDSMQPERPGSGAMKPDKFYKQLRLV